MSTISQKPHIAMVESMSTLLSLLDHVANLSSCPSSLFLDLEGVKLGRHGSISIMSLYIALQDTVYLVDIHRLGGIAFATANSHNISLKSILESSTIPKVMFDVRNDSNALFSQYGISVDGIKDLQLMELATRRGSKDFVAGLAKCIEKDSLVSAEVKADWQCAKDDAIHLFDPDKGGQYEIFNKRPFRPEIVRYCTQDVALLSGLYSVYDTKLGPPGETFWRVQVEEATKDRIKLSQGPNYDGQAKSKICGPWSEWSIEQARDDWNEEIMFNAMHGDDLDNDEETQERNEEITFNAMYGDELDNDDIEDDRDETTARECIGWEEDMMKNGEWF